MGKTDILTKDYMSNSERFADVFNYFIYQGREVIHAGDLQEKDPAELLTPAYGEEKQEIHKKERDLMRSAVIKKADEVYYVLLGLEDQSFVDYTMPVRKMVYESLRYEQQVKDYSRLYETRRKNGELVKMTSDEFLSGLKKEDKLIPVITLTILWNDRSWDGPNSLHDMLDIRDESLRAFVDDYRLNLIVPRELTKLHLFRTDMKQVFEMIQSSHDKQRIKELLEGDEAYQHMGKDAAMIIKNCAGLDVKLDLDTEKEEVDMCQGLKDLIQDCREEVVVGIVRKLSMKGTPIDEIAEVVELTVAKVQEILIRE